MNVTPPVEIASWLACLTFCVMLFNQLSKVWYTLRGKPTPQEQADRASGISERVKDVERTSADHGRRLDAIEKRQDEHRELINKEIDKVFNSVNKVAEVTNIMRGELGVIKAQLAALLGAKGK